MPSTRYPDLTESIQTFLQGTLQLAKADAAAVWLISQEEERQGQKEMAASTGFDRKRISKTDEERVARAVVEKKTIKIDALHQDQQLLKTEWMAQSGFVSYLGMPIIAKDGVAGVLELFYRSPFSDTFGGTDFINAIAKQSSFLIYTIQFLRRMHHHDQPNGIQPRPDQSERSSGVEEFISKTTHELNNVLTIVRDYAQLLEMAIPDGESKKNAQLVFNGATKASKIAGTLLAFARAQITKKKTVSLNEILQRALELKSDDLNSNKIRIVKDLDPSLPSTLIDPNQLQQIFLDLITQATTAMKMTDQERILSIVTRNVGNKVQIRFSDNSPRMPGQDSSKISKSLSAGQEDGNGAGLLNSYEIMRTEAAKIRIENQSGTETTYFVELPIPTDEVQKTINHNHSSRCCSFSGKKGLLIDDDVQVMKLLSNLFKIEGCETEVVPDGKLALEKIDRSSYDFILCDVKMPTMNGITLYQQLNKKGSACLDKIIFITGDVISYDAEEFLRSVKNPVLLKPFNLEEVKGTVQRVLNRLQSENGKTAQGPEK